MKISPDIVLLAPSVYSGVAIIGKGAILLALLAAITLRAGCLSIHSSVLLAPSSQLIWLLKKYTLCYYGDCSQHSQGFMFPAQSQHPSTLILLQGADHQRTICSTLKHQLFLTSSLMSSITAKNLGFLGTFICYMVAWWLASSQIYTSNKAWGTADKSTVNPRRLE
jgi:hypothetical protein